MASISIDYDLLAAAVLRAGGKTSGQLTALVAPGGGQVGEQAVSGRGLASADPEVGKGRLEAFLGVAGGAGGAGAVGPVGKIAGLAEVSSDEGGFDFVKDSGAASDAGSGTSVVSGGVRPNFAREKFAHVKFGGFNDEFPVERVQSPPGYFATVVRSPQATQLRERVELMMGAVKIPKAAREDLAVCTFTAGTMPDVVVNGKKRLRSLAAVGDAAITLHLVAEQHSKGNAVDSAQALRSRFTSNAFFCSAMVKSGLIHCVSYAPGVDPNTSVASATALEAIVGTMVLYRETSSVRMLLLNMGILGN